MKVLQFATQDIGDGAGKASYRLHLALRDAGVSSNMIVRYKESSNAHVQAVTPGPFWRVVTQRASDRAKRIIPLLGENPPLDRYALNNSFNLDVEQDLDPTLFFSNKPKDVDIIGLHLIKNLLRVKTIKALHDYYHRPMVWTLMDVEPITGGCHYSYGCTGFTQQCGKCPLLHSSNAHDHSRTVWQRKSDYLRNLPITFIAPTHWVADRIRESSLFGQHPLQIIPLALDPTTFRPIDRHIARDLLHVPCDKKVIFFGSATLTDSRKGMAYLREALLQLPSLLINGNGTVQPEDIFVLMAGRESKELAESLPFPNRQVGYLRDDVTLALAYQAADVFVCPSTEDAGPMMIPESMLCGTPVVAFNAGGAPDLITSMETGYLAAYKDSADLAHGIHALLTSDALPAIGAAAHEAAAERHAPTTVAAQYLDLYRSLIMAP